MRANRRISGYARVPFDLYQTPPWVTAELMPHLPERLRIWEPACGDGKMVAALKDAGHTVRATDIGDGSGVNFLHCQDADGIDGIITNPPFSLAREFAQHALDLMKPSRGLNGTITLPFTLDSGAADVSVPLDVFSTLRRTGTIKDTDITGEQTYVLADGSTRQAAMFTIRSLKVGDKIVENVKGSVAPLQGSLLLGQSFLERFKSWSIDNTKHVLLLEPQ